MKKRFLLSLLMLPAMLQAQPIINSWIMNQNGKLASYWAVTGNPPAAPSFSFTNTTDSADVLKVCYTADSVWVRSHGMTDNMGKYQNPGNCVAQNYTFRFPRNPVAATVKKEAPMVGSIGLLLNGIPIFGLSNANSWTGSTNAGPQGGGQGVWNVEVYKAEGMVLDTAFGAHPQQQGAYHSHATPY
ncbi:MAG: YHYH protein, partial [Sphingobacteriales bacterium]